MNRDEILAAAKKCVCGQREQDYGTPENNFACIANLWSSYLAQRLESWANSNGSRPLLVDSTDVAAMLALLKIARIASGHNKDDNWIDLAGYAACGGEIATQPPKVVRCSTCHLWKKTGKKHKDINGDDVNTGVCTLNKRGEITHATNGCCEGVREYVNIGEK